VCISDPSLVAFLKSRSTVKRQLPDGKEHVSSADCRTIKSNAPQSSIADNTGQLLCELSALYAVDVSSGH